jgi:hypothetical protein
MLLEEHILPKVEMYNNLIINLKFYFPDIRKRNHAL